MVAVACSVFNTAQADPARDLSRCVQHQITDLGYNPGPIDGVIGPQTRKAAAQLRQTHPLRGLISNLPPVDRYSAVSWCRELSRLSATAGRYRPALDVPKIAVDDTLGIGPRGLVKMSAQSAMGFFRSKHSIRLTSRVEFAASNSLEGISTQAKTLDSTTPPRLSHLRDWAKTGCGRKTGVTGVAFNTAIFFCWPLGGSHNKVWANLIRKEFEHVMVHEMMHLVQRELAHEVVPQRQRKKSQSNMGPNWLVEGAAVLIADQYSRKTKTQTRSYFLGLHRRASANDVTLFELRNHNAVPENRAYYAATLATHVLAQRYGTASLFDFWRNVGIIGSAERAFAETFGLPLATYEQVFEEHRRSFVSLIAYAQGED